MVGAARDRERRGRRDFLVAVEAVVAVGGRKHRLRVRPRRPRVPTTCSSTAILGKTCPRCATVSNARRCKRGPRRVPSSRNAAALQAQDSLSTRNAGRAAQLLLREFRVSVSLCAEPPSRGQPPGPACIYSSPDGALLNPMAGGSSEARPRIIIIITAAHGRLGSTSDAPSSQPRCPNSGAKRGGGETSEIFQTS